MQAANLCMHFTLHAKLNSIICGAVGFDSASSILKGLFLSVWFNESVMYSIVEAIDIRICSSDK